MGGKQFKLFYFFGCRCEGQCWVTEKCGAVNIRGKCVGKNDVCNNFLEYVLGGCGAGGWWIARIAFVIEAFTDGSLMDLMWTYCLFSSPANATPDVWLPLGLQLTTIYINDSCVDYVFLFISHFLLYRMSEMSENAHQNFREPNFSLAHTQEHLQIADFFGQSSKKQNILNLQWY